MRRCLPRQRGSPAPAPPRVWPSVIERRPGLCKARPRARPSPSRADGAHQPCRRPAASAQFEQPADGVGPHLTPPAICRRPHLRRAGQSSCLIASQIGSAIELASPRRVSLHEGVGVPPAGQPRLDIRKFVDTIKKSGPTLETARNKGLRRQRGSTAEPYAAYPPEDPVQPRRPCPMSVSCSSVPPPSPRRARPSNHRARWCHGGGICKLEERRGGPRDRWHHGAVILVRRR